MNLIGLAACGVGLAASGGLAILAGAVAFASLAGSLAIAAWPDESPCERYGRECRENPVIAATEPSIGQAPQESPHQQWQEAVAASRSAGRHR